MLAGREGIGVLDWDRDGFGEVWGGRFMRAMEMILRDLMGLRIFNRLIIIQDIFRGVRYFEMDLEGLKYENCIKIEIW